MNGPVRGRRAHVFLLLLPLLGAVAFPASRSDAAEGPMVSPNTVAEGLKTIERAGAEIVEYAGKEQTRAEQEAGVIEPIWEMIEGTIRANNKDSYVAFEAALDDLTAAAKAGDAKKAGAAAGALSSATQFYVAKFPAGGAPAAAPARTADAAPKPAAAAPKETAASADKTAAAADEKKAAAAAPAAEAGGGTLARTGPSTALTAVAGAAFALGGLAVIGGARRRRSATTA